MEDASERPILAQERPVRHRGAGWQIFWFLFHLAVVYAIVNVCTPLLAQWTRDTLLPLLQHPSSSGRFEYLYSHLFVFSFIPGFVAGLVNARFRHIAAQFVRLLPAVILAYEFAMFPSPSVLQSQRSAAFHQYFGGGFTIPEFRNWHEFLSIAGLNSDMARGKAQTNFTAPAYAGIGYSLAAWIGLRTELNRKLAERVTTWEESRFGPQS
jgi:hypothetical protein